MELEGVVGDVRLEEVLRLLALSRRSGTLQVQGNEESGFIRLHEGRVVGARVDQDRLTVEEHLLAAEVLDRETLQGMDAAQRRLPLPAAVASLQVVMPELPEEIQAALTQRVGTLVLRLLGARRGRFRFHTEVSTDAQACFLADQGVVLAVGMEAEPLVARARRARGSAPPAAAAPAASVPPRTAAPELRLVDDDEVLREAVVRHLRDRGVQVQSLASAAEAMHLVEQDADQAHVATVADLVMPHVSGRGILGGLDLTRRIRAAQPAARVIMTAEVEHPDAQARARELGVRTIIHKPATLEGVPDYADALLAAAGLSDRAGSVDLGKVLASEMGDEVSSPPRVVTNVLQKGMELVREMMGPVNDPERRDEIPLMILQVAASVFSRGAIFLVSGQDLVGLGAFGLEAVGRDPGKVIRDTHIPLDADTVLAAAVRQGRPVRLSFFESEWNRYLAERLAGPVPREAYVAPLLCSHRVEAVVYGDQAVDRKPLGDTRVLELFLTQAGVAMERVLLERGLAAELGQVTP